MNHVLEGAKLSVELPDEPVMCIGRFDGEAFHQYPPPQNPSVFFTMTVSKEQVSAGGKFIRLEHGGSEVHGWFRRDSIIIEEVLGKAVKNAQGLWEAAQIAQEPLAEAESA